MTALLTGAVWAATPDVGPVVEDVQGVTVKDAFRGLEDAATAKPFLAEQNARTDAWLKDHAVPGLRARLDQLLTIGYVARPRVGGDRVFFVRQEGRSEQPQFFYRQAAKARPNAKEPPPMEKLLLDLSKEDPTGKTALDWFHPSSTGKYVAYGISHNGDENSVLSILELPAGKKLPDTIADTRWCDLTWLKDDSGFFYRRFPHGERYSPRLYFHKLGTDPAKDTLIFGDGLDKTFWPGTAISEDGKALLITVSRGWSASDLYWMDVATRVVKPLVVGLPALFEDGLIRDGKVYVVTNLDAPRGRLIRVDPNAPAKEHWETLVPEGTETLKDVMAVKDRLITLTLDRAVSRMQVRSNDGKLLANVALPGVGTVNAADARADQERLVVEWASFVNAPRLLSVDTSKPVPDVKTLVEVKTDLNLSNVVVEQTEYRSYDGTSIPMFLVHAEGMKRDGHNAVLLTGYGGFNVSMSPGFSRRYLYWLENGGVLAIPNLRGGGELGEGWHEAGRKQNKHQVFSDFEYAMRHLIAQNITRPDRLCILGGSNGGLLMGSQITRAPYLFRAAYAAVGLFDMVRFHRWPPAELWVDEYGSSDVKTEAPYLWAYSPYHQVMDGVHYPAVMVATAEQDTRVTWIHSAKFAARLMQAQGGPDPILLHVEGNEGHGQGKGRSDILDENERMFTFFLAQVPLH